MCLDIDPDSVIHKHLVKKLTDESWGSYTALKENDPNYGVSWEKLERVEKWRLRSPSSKSEDAYHSLTMLPSFHISLGAPPKDIKPQTIQLFIDDDTNLGLQQIIGSIALANIFVSAKNNKKSAWIDVTNLTFRLIDQEVETQIVNEDSHLHVLSKYYHAVCRRDVHREWHISLANLTGNPHDSIARPEECIIDTITA